MCSIARGIILVNLANYCYCSMIPSIVNRLPAPLVPEANIMILAPSMKSFRAGRTSSNTSNWLVVAPNTLSNEKCFDTIQGVSESANVTTI